MPFRIRDLLISIDPTRQGEGGDACRYLVSLCEGHSPVPAWPLVHAITVNEICKDGISQHCPRPPSTACAPITAGDPAFPVPPASEREIAQLQAQLRQLTVELERRESAARDPAVSRRLSLEVISDLERRFTEALEELEARRREIERETP